MTDKERITELEKRLAAAEARIAQLEQRPTLPAVPPTIYPRPLGGDQTAPSPWRQPMITWNAAPPAPPGSVIRVETV